MDSRTPQPPTPADPSEGAAIAAALAGVPADGWTALWAAVDAVTVEETHATWDGGDVIDTTIVDGVERPVIQMPYPIYSASTERLIELLYELGLVVPFNWMEWDGHERYPAGVGLADAPVADSVRMITAIVRSERFCDGAIEGAWSDGTFPAALARLRTHSSSVPARPHVQAPAAGRPIAEADRQPK